MIGEPREAVAIIADEFEGQADVPFFAEMLAIASLRLNAPKHTVLELVSDFYDRERNKARE